MRVFMLGWEFPPFISGGLGTACYGLTKAMSAAGADVLFILPRPVSPTYSTHVRLVAPQSSVGSSPGSTQETSQEHRLEAFENVSFRTIDALGSDPYQRPGDLSPMTQKFITRSTTRVETQTTRHIPSAGNTPVQSFINQTSSAPGAHYAGDMFAEVHRYASLASDMAKKEEFDVIHAHDWMTYPAAMAVAAATGKPLVVHVHSTEFDRSGQNVDSRIYDIERRGMHAALKVIAVSHLTKNLIIHHYGVSADKVEVVYNAIDLNGGGNGTFDATKYNIKKDEKIVLFFGRITMQKGPEYFIAAAKKVLEVMENVKFIMAGSGDMIRRTIEMAAAMGIGHKVLFTGFLRGKDIDEVFKKADLYVMPSVSEPFGIAPLEAIAHDVPVIISKQSGVSEVLENVLKVDFWDVNEMANKIVSVLKHPALSSTLREHGAYEVKKLSWADSAVSCIKVYEEAIALGA